MKLPGTLTALAAFAVMGVSFLIAMDGQPIITAALIIGVGAICWRSK